VIPYNYLGDSLFWQVKSGFHFRMPGGEFSPLHGKGFRGTTFIRLLHDDVRVGDGATVLEFAREHDVGTILLDPTDPWPWQQVLEPLGKPVAVGGVLLYPIASDKPTSIGCRAQKL
jgi:hypothetical protein